VSLAHVDDQHGCSARVMPGLSETSNIIQFLLREEVAYVHG
jgi:hypothetical protein